MIADAQLVKAPVWLCADTFLNPTTPCWWFWKSVAALQAFMMSSRGSVAPLLNRASQRKEAAMNADVNTRVCIVAGWTSTVVVVMAVAATAAAPVLFDTVTVAAVAVPVVGPRLIFCLEAGVMPAIRPTVAAWGAVEPVTDEADAACRTIVPAAGVVSTVRPVVVAAWGAIEPVIVEAVAACEAIVLPVANPPLARVTRSSIDLQLAILVVAGMVMVKEATAVPWFMMTALALGPILIRLAMKKLRQERVPPNFNQLCVLCKRNF
jgi:hypothetical protein